MVFLDKNTTQFLRNIFRKNIPPMSPESGMAMINLANATTPIGDPLMSVDELDVFVSAFKTSGFTSSINWYRNLDRNWHILADVNPIIKHHTLMIYGNRDLIPKSENLTDFVPNVDVCLFGLWALDSTRNARRNQPNHIKMASRLIFTKPYKN